MPRRNGAKRVTHKQVSKKKNSGYNSREGLVSAPAAVSDYLRQQIRFSSSGAGRNLVIRCCMPLMNVGQGVSGTVTNNFGCMVDKSGTLVDRISFNPVAQNEVIFTGATPEVTIPSSEFINPAWWLLGSTFARYRLKKLKFHYMPQSSATQAGQLVFAFAADPHHPLIGFPPVQEALTPLDNSTLLSVADSIPFMPWREWSVDVTQTIDQEALLFTASSGNAIYRFSQAGVIALTSSIGNTSTAAPITYGVLYAEVDLELVEFCPIQNLSVTLLNKKEPTSSRKADERDLKESRLKSDDLDDNAIVPERTTTVPVPRTWEYYHGSDDRVENRRVSPISYSRVQDRTLCQEHTVPGEGSARLG